MQSHLPFSNGHVNDSWIEPADFLLYRVWAKFFIMSRRFVKRIEFVKFSKTKVSVNKIALATNLYNHSLINDESSFISQISKSSWYVIYRSKRVKSFLSRLVKLSWWLSRYPIQDNFWLDLQVFWMNAIRYVIPRAEDVFGWFGFQSIQRLEHTV